MYHHTTPKHGYDCRASFNIHCDRHLTSYQHRSKASRHSQLWSDNRLLLFLTYRSNAAPTLPNFGAQLSPSISLYAKRLAGRDVQLSDKARTWNSVRQEAHSMCSYTRSIIRS
mmetsp:Transcript_76672/g.135399  ORF Transcript_76672/g.135399 Transcript_76672/m.135399 type:complete len:113 (-) Transcript_76672:183-521(-)